ncbi:hypothetical protein KC334_g17208, partial [Hortaea werneckii]
MQVTQGSPSLGRSPTFDPSPSAVVGGPDIIPSTTITHHVDATTPSAVKSEESSTPAEGGDPSSKPKQKRNKPTLSCLECVERKTKCDRARPCLACVKRQSACEYTAVANLIASADRNNVTKNKRRVTAPPSKIRKTSMSSGAVSPTPADNGWATIENRAHRKSMSSNGSSPFLLSNMPFSTSSPSNVFGVGQTHPFSNYWTCQGGLPEVISVLPSKEQADILIARYFEVVDPVYPFLHRRSFYADYERFWALS